jgi:hypothetical protein
VVEGESRGLQLRVGPVKQLSDRLVCLVQACRSTTEQSGRVGGHGDLCLRHLGVCLRPPGTAVPGRRTLRDARRTIGSNDRVFSSRYLRSLGIHTFRSHNWARCHKTASTGRRSRGIFGILQWTMKHRNALDKVDTMDKLNVAVTGLQKMQECRHGRHAEAPVLGEPASRILLLSRPPPAYGPF